MIDKRASGASSKNSNHALLHPQLHRRAAVRAQLHPLRARAAHAATACASPFAAAIMAFSITPYPSERQHGLLQHGGAITSYLGFVGVPAAAELP